MAIGCGPAVSPALSRPSRVTGTLYVVSGGTEAYQEASLSSELQGSKAQTWRARGVGTERQAWSHVGKGETVNKRLPSLATSFVQRGTGKREGARPWQRPHGHLVPKCCRRQGGTATGLVSGESWAEAQGGCLHSSGDRQRVTLGSSGRCGQEAKLQKKTQLELSLLWLLGLTLPWFPSSLSGCPFLVSLLAGFSAFIDLIQCASAQSSVYSSLLLTRVLSG